MDTHPEFDLIQVPLDTIDAVLLRPHEADEPGILFWLIDGTEALHVAATDAECDEMWATIERKLFNELFVRYDGIMFRAESIVRVDRKNSPGVGEHICLQLRNARTFSQQYNDADQLSEDFGKVTEILGTLQDIRASRSANATKQ